MKIMTSSRYKHQAFADYGVETVEGPDIEEVLGTALEVILYKTLEAPHNYVVEDTILELEDGTQIVDLKFRDLRDFDGQLAKLVVSLGRRDGTKVFITQSSILVKVDVDTSIKDKAGQVDASLRVYSPLFKTYNYSIADRILAGTWSLEDPRKFALEKMKQGEYFCVKYEKDIPEWKGLYQ